jgi:hypothetical protein
MNRYKLYFLLLFIFSLSPTIKAQELAIDWGQEFDSKTEVQKILGFTNDRMVAYSLKGEKRYIETYNSEGLRIKSSKELILPSIQGKTSGMLNLALTNENVTCILYTYTKKTKSFSLYSYALSLEGRRLGKPELLYKSEAMDERIKDMVVDVQFSPSSKKALVYFNRTDKKRTQFFSDVIVLNLEEKMSKESEAQHTFKIRADKSEKVDFNLRPSIEDDGTYFLVQEKVEFYRSKILDFALIVGKYNKKGIEIGSTKLTQEGKLLLSPTLVVKEDKIVVVGYYMEIPKKNQYILGYAGLFSAELTNDMTLQQLKTEAFGNEIWEKVYKPKQLAKARKKGRELYIPAAYGMKEIYVHKDGSMTVLSELHTVAVYADRGRKTTTTVYGPIIFFKLNENGEISNADIIQKYQTSSTTSASIGVGLPVGVLFVSVEFPDKKVKYWSYASLMDDQDNIYLIFNDHFKNANDNQDEVSKPMTNPKKSVPYLTTIKHDGTFEKKAMVESGDTETYMVPQVIYPFSESEFVILGVWRKSHKFGIATIKE